MEKDPDLENLRGIEEFRNMVEKLKAAPPSENSGCCAKYGGGMFKWRFLERKINRLFENGTPEDLEAARELLKQQESMRPRHPIPIYNLACVEARLGNPRSALDYLSKAIQLGWNDVNHMEKDTDLDSLRSLEEYKTLVAALKSSSQQSPCQPSCQPSSCSQQPCPSSCQPSSCCQQSPLPVPQQPPIEVSCNTQPSPSPVPVPQQPRVVPQPAPQPQVSENVHPWDWLGNLQPLQEQWEPIIQQWGSLVNKFFQVPNRGDYVQSEEEFQALLASLADQHLYSEEKQTSDKV